MDQASRPISATVVAIIGLIFGFMALCAQPFSLMAYLVDLGPNPVLDVIKASDALYLFMVSFSILGLFMALLEIIGSMGLLFMKPWGRALMVFYALVTLLMLFIHTVVYCIFLLPHMLQTGDPIMVGSAVGGLAGGCVGGVIPLAFVIVLTRPNVAEAYRGAL